MINQPLDVGVVGVGHLGRHHARLYSQLPGARLVAVVDRDLDRAHTIASEFGCAAFSEPSALIGKVTAASVAVPTESHLSVALMLLEAGVDLLIEKPLARTLEEADRIIDAAERRGCRVMVGHTERFNPAVRALAEEVESPRFFEIHRLAAFSSRSTDIDVILDLMIHDLDLLGFLDGSEPVSIDAVGVAALTDKVDIANARIRLDSGCVANLTASRISTEPVRRVRIFQTQTYLSCDTQARKVESYRLVAEPGRRPHIEHRLLPVRKGEPLGLELEAFIAAVASKTDPPVDARQGRRALELANQVLESISRDSGTGVVR